MKRSIVVIVAVAIVAAACGDGLPVLETEPVRSRRDAVANDAGYSSETPFVQLDDCPIEAFESVIEDSVAAIDDPVVRAALDGEPTTYISAANDAGEPLLACALFGDEGEGVGIYVVDAPADLDEYVEESAEFDDGGVSITIDESRELRGGRFHHVCVRYDDVDDGYCEVVWIDESVLIGLFVTGAGGDRVDTDGIEENYRYLVPIVVERLSE